MISKTWGVFPTATEVKKAGKWDGVFYWELKGLDKVVAEACGLYNDWRPTSLKELFAGVRKLVRAEGWSDRKIRSVLRKARVESRYSIDEFRDEASSLASGVMQVACDVDWI